MQAIAASGSGGGLSAKDLLMSQLDESDPTTSLLVNLLSQPSASAPADTHEPDEDDFERYQAELRAKERAAERAKALRHLRNTVDTLYAELEDLRARNDALAAAVGACHLCWGEDATCPECGGQGQPGHYAIDHRLFHQLIVPAVHRYKRETHLRTAPTVKPAVPTHSNHVHPSHIH
jgi:hypothetical protein